MSKKTHRFKQRPKYVTTAELPPDLTCRLHVDPFHPRSKNKEAGKVTPSGMKYGWHYYFTNNRIVSESLYEEGVRVEDHIYVGGYFRLGKVVQYTHHPVAHKITTSIDLDDYGRRYRSVPTNRAGKVHGVYKEWDSRTGKLYLSATFKQGILHGPVKIYHTNGTIKEVGNMTKGKRNGHHRVYYPSGKLKLTREYINGKRLGWTTLYQEDGRIICTTRSTRANSWATVGSYSAQSKINTETHEFLQFLKKSIHFGKPTARLTFFASRTNSKAMPDPVVEIVNPLPHQQ